MIRDDETTSVLPRQFNHDQTNANTLKLARDLSSKCWTKKEDYLHLWKRSHVFSWGYSWYKIFSFQT